MALSKGTQVALGALVAGGLATLVFTDSGGGVLEYVYVETVVGQREAYEDREIQVHGTVVEGSVVRKRDRASEYRFVIEHGNQRLDVHYEGIVPDTFQEKGEVVLTGRLQGSTFVAHEMSAKCPSKYDAGKAMPKTTAPSQS